MIKLFDFAYDKSTWTWFDIYWPWIGLIASILILLLLFTTNVFRHNFQVQRWKDPLWLSWLAIPIYMLHEFEEYGIDMKGVNHAFPNGLCSNLNLGEYPQCPIPHEFYLYVNIPLVWVFAVLATTLSAKNAFLGLGLYSVIISNGVVHIALFVIRQSYNPGVLTSLVLFLPSFWWVCRANFGNGGFAEKGITVIIVTGIILHAILISSLLFFVNHKIDSTTLNFIQILNASVIVIVPWLGDRLLKIRKNNLLV